MKSFERPGGDESNADGRGEVCSHLGPSSVVQARLVHHLQGSVRSRRKPHSFPSAKALTQRDDESARGRMRAGVRKSELVSSQVEYRPATEHLETRGVGRPYDFAMRQEEGQSE